MNMLFFLVALLVLLPYCVGDVTLYTLTMGDPNQVNVFGGADPGNLQFVKSVSTGKTGLASGDPGIQSQNPIIVYDNFLFGVNTRDSSISLFNIPPNDPTNIVLVDTQSTNFEWPNSIAVIEDYVCVVSSGASNGFRCYFYNTTTLLPLPSWDRSFALNLTTPPITHTGPAQISFTPNYDGLVISNKGANPPVLLYTWNEGQGPSANAALSPIQGAVPFGFTFIGSDLILTDASPLGGFGGIIEVNLQIAPTPLVTFATDYFLIPGQDATCWITYSKVNDLLYAANAASSTVSVIKFDDDTFTSVANLTYSDQTGFTNNAIATVSGKDYLYQYAGGNVIVVDLSNNNKLQTFSAKNTANGAGVTVYVSSPQTNPPPSSSAVKIAVSNALVFIALLVCFFL